MGVGLAGENPHPDQVLEEGFLSKNTGTACGTQIYTSSTLKLMALSHLQLTALRNVRNTGLSYITTPCFFRLFQRIKLAQATALFLYSRELDAGYTD